MTHRLEFRRYRLPFRGAVRTAHGPWTERDGVLLRLESESGEIGWGEAAPIPAFGTETVEEIEAACRALGDRVDAAAIASVPERLGCLRQALAAATSAIGPPAHPHLAVAALLPAGRAALTQIPPRAESGHRVFKWKVGVGDPADELVLLDDVCAALPPGASLRLDANGAWDRRQAERWLERCAERPVEFVEQPCPSAPTGSSPDARRREMDLLLGLAGDFPTPLGLDESLVVAGDFARWIEVGWPGVYVVKPSLLANPGDALARLEKASAKVVFSSALETAVGARQALRLAFRWPGEPTAAGGRKARALGFGVWPLFADRRFDGPATAPFLRAEDVEKINPEAAWTALG